MKVATVRQQEVETFRQPGQSCCNKKRNTVNKKTPVSLLDIGVFFIWQRQWELNP